MRQKNRQRLIVVIGAVILFGVCLAVALAVAGSGLAVWVTVDKTAVLPSPTTRLVRWSMPTLTPTPAFTATPTHTLTPAWTPTAIPTTTPPATDTPTTVPTSTPSATPAQAPPAATPAPSPTDTPAPPAFPFVIQETASFPTNHFDFDVYVAITDQDNKPLSGYRVAAQHSSGQQTTTETSAGDWTVNSGAMHYKAGNLKVSVPKSDSGAWALQLLDEAGNPVAPIAEFQFDNSAPTWYFIIYKRD